jgi:serine/threonine-protein kinase
VNTERWRRLEGALDQLLDAEEAERPALLDRLAAGDVDFGRDLGELLAAESEARDWLERPVEGFAPDLLASAARESSDRAHDDLVGRRLGPYRLLREIGRGGMGTVFLAERADGQFEQRVALKLVRADLRSASARRRFLDERSLLARLSHPGIARLLDGGVTEEGAPYLVLEYVEGLPLLEHVRQHRLGLDARLSLFLGICRAVEHAHRSLVVHRDLKPANVLVTAEGEVKLLDFGIARLLADGGTEARIDRTRFDERALTPEYAAPELLLGGAVTTATDVYSLGALLYELATGRRPVEVDAGSLLELERALRDQRPEPPSRRAAGSTGTEAGFARRLAGDLDAVVLKALEKRPEDRYASVAELADDLTRARSLLPVRARRLSPARRALRFVRRHRLAVAVSAAAIALVALGVASTLWQARRALREAERVRQVKDFTLGLFESSDPDVAGGDRLTAEQILERGLERIDRDLAGQPALQADMLEVVGDVLLKLGRYDEARGPFERAVALRRAVAGESPAELGRALVRLGDAAHFRLDLDRAEALYREAAAIQGRALGDDHPDRLATLALLGRVALDRGDAASASDQLGPLLRRSRGALGDDHPLAVEIEAALAEARLRTGDAATAERLFAHVLAVQRSRFPEVHSEVATAENNHGAALEALGRLAAAEAAYRRALAIDERLLGPAHPGLAPDLNNLASLLTRRGRCREAVEHAGAAVGIERARRHGGDATLAAFLYNFARALTCAGQPAEAVAAAREAVGLERAAFGDDHELVAASRAALARALGDSGELDAAEPLLRSACAALAARLGHGDPRRAECDVALGRLMRLRGDATAAERVLDAALESLRARCGDADLRTAEAALELGLSRLELGRAEAARGVLDRSALVLRAELPETDRRRREVESALRRLP